MISDTTKIPGWFDPAEADAIMRTAWTIGRTGTLIEIGTWAGRSTAMLAERLPAWIIHTIDPYPAGHAVTVPDPNDPALIARPQEYAAKTLSAYGNVIRHISDAATVSAAWDTHRPIDILFVDGQHETIQVMIDINSWVGFCHDRSVVFLHDARGTPYSDAIMSGAINSKLFQPPKWRQRYELQAGSLAVFSK